MSGGRVYLVGAGPGDPDLLTLRALRVLHAADVVLHDALVDRRVLALVPGSARCIDVGKRGGCRSTPQAFIERLAVREALAGHAVVRLKGGDPFVFGRGGEEARRIARRGVVVEVVPGITAGLAAPARFGIAVTDRACAHGVVLVTGRSASAPLEWAALARSGLTLAIYMGIGRCTQICRGLLDGGLPATTPAAVVQQAWCAGERAHFTTLGRLAGEVEALGFAAPSVLVIGEVARHGARLRAELALHADTP